MSASQPSRPDAGIPHGESLCGVAKRIVDLSGLSVRYFSSNDGYEPDRASALARPANRALIAKDAVNQGAKALKPVAAIIVQLAKVANSAGRTYLSCSPMLRRTNNPKQSRRPAPTAPVSNQTCRKAL